MTTLLLNFELPGGNGQKYGIYKKPTEDEKRLPGFVPAGLKVIEFEDGELVDKIEMLIPAKFPKNWIPDGQSYPNETNTEQLRQIPWSDYFFVISLKVHDDNYQILLPLPFKNVQHFVKNNGQVSILYDRYDPENNALNEKIHNLYKGIGRSIWEIHPRTAAETIHEEDEEDEDDEEDEEEIGGGSRKIKNKTKNINRKNKKCKSKNKKCKFKNKKCKSKRQKTKKRI